MSYIGNPIVSTDFPVDYFSGNGSTTAFTLSIAPASVNAVDVLVSGVSQSPQTYTISGTTLTFSAAPPSGSSNIVVKHRGIAGVPNVPSAASVTTTSIASNAVTPAKMANGGAEFGMRNRIINGAMMIDQRNTGASVTLGGGTTVTLDRWSCWSENSSKYSVQQNAGSVTPPVGFSNYLGVTSLAATTVGSADVYMIRQYVEGFNFADCNWGTANAKTVTLSFWVRSSLTGTFGGAFYNSAGDRSYPFTYTILSANTWEYKTITVAGDTTGTWVGATNGKGVSLALSLGAGSTYSGTAGSWASAGYFSATGATSVVGTNGATFYITGVQLEVGSSATGFEYRQYGQELALCQRYYYQNSTGAGDIIFYSTYIGGAGNNYHTIVHPVVMRTAPTGTIIGSWYTSNSGQPSFAATTQYASRFINTSSGSGAFYTYNANSGNGYSLSAEL